jgi:predicted aspartyl protease
VGENPVGNVIEETPEIVQIDLIRKTNDGLFIEGTIQQQSLTFLVDTGASVTVIKTNVYQDLAPSNRPPLEEVNARMVTADGTPIPFLGKGMFTLCIEGTDILHDVWVADIDIDGIIGFDFLDQHKCLLDVNRGKLQFGDFPGNPYDEDEDDEDDGKRIGLIAAKQDYEVPPESEMFIAGYLQNQPD